jgi:phage terminase large subunit-like protein
MRPNTFVVHSFTWENLGNVSPRWYAEQVERLHGTQQGREEIDGELETDDGSEMFSLSVIDGQRRPMPTTFTRIGVAVDPSGNDKKRSDLAGIVAAGLVGNIHTGHGYMIEDASEKLSWDAWGHKTVVLAEERGASFILCETNKFSGGVSANIRTAAAARGYVATTRPGTKHQIDLVQGSRRIELLEVHSKDDKITRAGPVSTLYQRGRFHHVGHWFELEDEMSEFSVGSLAHGASPNRMDALVHCVTELFELNRAPEENFEEVNRGYAGLVQQMGGGEPKHSPAPSQTPSSGSLAHLFGMYPRRPV